LKLNSVTSVTEFFVFADKIYSSANRYSPLVSTTIQSYNNDIHNQNREVTL